MTAISVIYYLNRRKEKRDKIKILLQFILIRRDNMGGNYDGGDEEINI